MPNTDTASVAREGSYAGAFCNGGGLSACEDRRLGRRLAALPIALMGRGVDVHLLLPGYPGAFTRIEKPRFIAKLDPILGVTDATLVSGTLPDTDLPVWLVDAPSLYRRTGSLYQDDDGRDWPDNALRFAFLSHVAAKLAMGRTKLAWKPDVVHANDWHAGLLPLLLSLEKAPRPSTVFTTHNMAFQGNFPASVLPTIGLPDGLLATDGIEFYGKVSFLKAGLRYADRVTTVSPNYAKEILTSEFGCGLEGLLRAREQTSREFSTASTTHCGILRLIIIFRRTTGQATFQASAPAKVPCSENWVCR